MQAFTQAIFTRLNATHYVPGGGAGLTTSNAFRTSVGARIRLLVAPSNSALPLATYSIDQPTTEHFFGGSRKQTATFTVSIFDKAESGADAMLGYEAQLFALFDNTELTISGHSRGYSRSLNRGAPELEGEYLRCDSRFEIMAFSS